MPLPNTFSLLVLGAGATGVKLAEWGVRHLGGRVSGVTLVGGASSSPTDATRALEAAGATVVYASEEIVGHFDVCVASPGISEFSDFFAAARDASDQIMGEPEFAWRLSPERWCAITGTNGKTTTTALAHHLLEAAGLSAQAVGNIGLPTIEAIGDRSAGDWLVAELSSYQIATATELHPSVAVLLNITPDHLSWHRSHQNYALAKISLFDSMDCDDLCIVDVDDSGIMEFRDRIFVPGRRILSVSLEDPGTPDAAWVAGDTLTVRLAGDQTPLVACDELGIAGTHNIINALCASAAAIACGADIEGVRRGLRSFRPLEHRVEPAGELEGVRFVNDSKATNTDAVVKALTAFPDDRIILLLGGADKGTPLAEFAAQVAASVSAVVCFGAARDRFRHALEDAEGSAEIDIALADDLRDAVDVARSLANRGDVVLLSPACASFDEFSNYEERGRAFKDYICALRDSAADDFSAGE